MEFIDVQQYPDAEVPCNGCTRCCKEAHEVLLYPGEEAKYRTRTRRGYVMLLKKPNGDCTYLTDKGCSVHDDAPKLCRTYDCSIPVHVLGISGALKHHSKGIVERGRELLKAGHVPVITEQMLETL